MEIEELLEKDGFECECGKKHYAQVQKVVICDNALEQIPQIINEYKAKSVFLLADKNTYKVAGEKVEKLLTQAGIKVNEYVFPYEEIIEPDEKAVGSAVMHYIPSDMIIGVGGGVINDTGKILSNLANKNYMIVGTAPSMDGYASATSSMARDGLKVSIPSKCPDVVIGDLEVLSSAPMEMILAGVGDMLAKYISICEWRIATILCGEYYCQNIADLIKDALAKVVKSAPLIIKRDKNAVKAVMEGMVLSGIAANYAGISRPVSGGEHYCSHVWDMRGLSYGTKVYLHGIQCGVATVEYLKTYDFLRKTTPNKQKALDFVKKFDKDKYNAYLREFVGDGAEAMIELEKKEGKYDAVKHAKRLEIIIDRWKDLTAIMDEELTNVKALSDMLKNLGAPVSYSDLGKTNEEMAKTLICSKDIRDKYVAGRLLWDLGIIDEATQELYGVKVFQ